MKNKDTKKERRIRENTNSNTEQPKREENEDATNGARLRRNARKMKTKAETNWDKCTSEVADKDQTDERKARDETQKRKRLQQ